MTTTRQGPTKKAFEQHLNATVPAEHGTNNGWGGNSGARTRPYGTWLRNADPDKFNYEYETWLEAQK